VRPVDVVHQHHIAVASDGRDSSQAGGVIAVAERVVLLLSDTFRDVCLAREEELLVRTVDEGEIESAEVAGRRREPRHLVPASVRGKRDVHDVARPEPKEFDVEPRLVEPAQVVLDADVGRAAGVGVVGEERAAAPAAHL
jgi:hypothetical protein